MLIPEGLVQDAGGPWWLHPRCRESVGERGPLCPLCLCGEWALWNVVLDGQRAKSRLLCSALNRAAGLLAKTRTGDNIAPRPCESDHAAVL